MINLEIRITVRKPFRLIKVLRCEELLELTNSVLVVLERLCFPPTYSWEIALCSDMCSPEWMSIWSRISTLQKQWLIGPWNKSRSSLLARLMHRWMLPEIAMKEFNTPLRTFCWFMQYSPYHVPREPWLPRWKFPKGGHSSPHSNSLTAAIPSPVFQRLKPEPHKLPQIYPLLLS